MRLKAKHLQATQLKRASVSDGLIAKAKQLMPTSQRTVGVVKGAIEAGELLNEAKQSVQEGGGKWTVWLKDHFPKRVQHARNCMRLATYRDELEKHCPNWEIELTIREALQHVSEHTLERRAVEADIQAFSALRSMNRDLSTQAVENAFTKFVHTLLLSEPNWWESWQIAVDLQDREYALTVCGQIASDGDIPKEIVAYLLSYFGGPLADVHELARHFLVKVGLAEFDELSTATLSSAASSDVGSCVSLWFVGLRFVIDDTFGYSHGFDGSYFGEDDDVPLSEFCSLAEAGF